MKKSTQHGFTIVELLLAIALFAILIPTVIVSLNSIAAANDNTKDTVIANIVAENKIEELRSFGYNSVNTGTVDFSSTLPQTLGSPRSASYTVTNDTAGLKEVSLSITFTNRRGSHTLNYRTLIGELGVGQ
jgi:type II secretion system protein I